MSMLTILPISSIPILDDCDLSVNLGTVGKANWSLRPKWENLVLIYFEIFRTSGAGKVEIEINLQHSYEDKVQAERLYTASFEDGQTIVRIGLEEWPETFEEGDKLEGTVTIYTDCMECSKCTIKSSPTLKVSTAQSHLSDDLLGLLNNPDSFADATLKCGAAEILVHKSILSARSPVFGAMFKSQMKESCGVVDIVDIDESILKTTLKYIYSGKVDDLKYELARDLIFAADKYELAELKKICVAQLKLSITLDNVFRIIVIGDLLDESLKTHAMKFICKCDKFFELEEWKVLEKDHSNLAMEVLKCIVKSQKSW